MVVFFHTHTQFRFCFAFMASHSCPILNGKDVDNVKVYWFYNILIDAVVSMWFLCVRIRQLMTYEKNKMAVSELAVFRHSISVVLWLFLWPFSKTPALDSASSPFLASETQSRSRGFQKGLYFLPMVKTQLAWWLCFYNNNYQFLETLYICLFYFCLSQCL